MSKIEELTRIIKSNIVSCPDHSAVQDMLPIGGANKDFKRFIIFGHQRCGSSVLTSGLKSSSTIKAFAEIFTSNHITFNFKGMIIALLSY